MSTIEDSDYLGVRNDRTTQSREAGSDWEAIEEDCEEENKHPNDIRGVEREIEINTEKGNGVDCVGETEISEVVDSERVERSPICPTLRDLMILDDKDIDEPCFKTTTSPVGNNQPSTEQGHISTGCSDSNRRGQKTVSESKWKKKIEDCIAKVTNSSSAKKHQQADPDVEAILCETDVRGILELRREEERKSRAIKERRRWATSCICCLVRSQKNKKDREFQLELEEYLYSYAW